MTDLIVHPAENPLVGNASVPSDKSIGHRALIFAALADGVSTLRDFSFGADNVSTLEAFVAMGVGVEKLGPSSVAVRGVGLHGLKAPSAPLDCGNSGTTMRMMAGLLAAQPFASELIGDASLSKRPMRRIVEPLRARGAVIDGLERESSKPGRATELLPPLRIRGIAPPDKLRAISWDSSVASAQVKSALLLSGLYADGPTLVREPGRSRDHTERMLRALGVPVVNETVADMHSAALDPNAGWDGRLRPLDIEIIGDPSASAFLVTAAQIIKGSRIRIARVGTNFTRTGFFDMARSMGAGLAIEATGEVAGEPIATIEAWSESLRSTTISGDWVTRGIDEIPIACALAARASATTTIRDAAELRVKESDRLHTMAGVLAAFGVSCEEFPDGLTIVGREGPLKAAIIDSHGDHRIAMTAAIMALLGDGPTRIRDVDCIGTSFPEFVNTLVALGAKLAYANDA